MARYGDGELAVLKRRKYTVREWTWDPKRSESDAFRELLVQPFLDARAVNSSMFVGLPLYYCAEGLQGGPRWGGGGRKEWLDGYFQRGLADELGLHSLPLSHLIYSWQFGNLNYNGTLDLITELVAAQWPILVVGNGMGIAQLPRWADGMLAMPANDVVQVSQDLPAVRREAEALARSVNGTAFLFSVGPISNALVAVMHRANPNNIYADVGGSLDFALSGRRSRDFHPLPDDRSHFVMAGGALQEGQRCTEVRWDRTKSGLAPVNFLAPVQGTEIVDVASPRRILTQQEVQNNHTESGKSWVGEDGLCSASEVQQNVIFSKFGTIAFIRGIQNWTQCCMLCSADERCSLWTFIGQGSSMQTMRSSCKLKHPDVATDAEKVDVKLEVVSGTVLTRLYPQSGLGACRGVGKVLRKTETTDSVQKRLGYVKPGKWPAGEKELTALNEEPAKIPLHAFFIHLYPFLKQTIYLCALESFLARNPSHTIIVYTANVEDLRTKLEATSYNSSRIALKGIDDDSLLQWFSGTPLESWYKEQRSNAAALSKLNLCDALRLAILFKIGGTYLDLDVISLNSIEELGRSMAALDERETSSKHEAPWNGGLFVNNAFLRFPPQDTFVHEVMRALARKFDGSTKAKTGSNGPLLLTGVFIEHCLDTSPPRE